MQLVVTRTPTPLPQASIPSLVKAAFEALGSPLTGIQPAMLAVLVAIETARGRSMMNHNVGNITAGEKYEGAVWHPPWFDENEAKGNPRLEKLHAAMLEGKAPRAFRSYASVEEGAKDFARQLLHTFPEVMKASLVADADAFRRALSQKYSPDYKNEKATESLATLMREFGITAIAKTGGGTAGGLVLLALLWLAWKYYRA